MFGLNKSNIAEAETLRYDKIQNLINLLQGTVQNSALTNTIYGNDFPTNFNVGKKIRIDGEQIRIGKKYYSSNEINKVTINTEGSMAIYDCCDIKICGTLSINVSLKNIELFCIWVHKNNISAEVVSGKKERFFQYAILLITVTVLMTLKIMKFF